MCGESMVTLTAYLLQYFAALIYIKTLVKLGCNSNQKAPSYRQIELDFKNYIYIFFSTLNYNNTPCFGEIHLAGISQSNGRQLKSSPSLVRLS